MIQRAAPPAVVAAVSILVGCGGNGGSAVVPTAPGTAVDEGGYLEQVRAADGAVVAAGERLTAGTQMAELEEVRSELEETVRRLEQASPPYDLLPEHQRLTLALWDAVDAIQEIVDEGREEAADADLTPIVAALRDADEAIGEIEAKGYDVRRRT